jgi:hypothetical protein
MLSVITVVLAALLFSTANLKTDAEILNWSHDYLIESSREARKLFEIALMELEEELSRNRK